MKVKIFITGIILLMGCGASGQQVSYNYNQNRFNPYLNRLSYSIGIGTSAYQGELSNFFDSSLQKYYLNPSGSFGLAYRFFDHVSLRGEINVFGLYSESIIYEENNRFFSGFNIDYYLNGVIDLFPKSRIDGGFYKWDGHVFGGIGQVMFFPSNNNIRGEGTGVIISDSTTSDYDFAKLSVIFPIGAGVKYYIDKNHYLSLEGNYRFTKTDFLDALKDLDNPAFDKYFSLFFKYTVVIDWAPLKTFRYGDYIEKRKKRSKE